MSLHTVLVTIEGDALAALRQVGHVIESVVVSETQALVAQVKNGDLGTKAMNIIAELASSADSGEQKMARLIGLVVGDLAALHAAGGIAGLTITVEDFAREFGQSAYNDFKAATVAVR